MIFMKKLTTRLLSLVLLGAFIPSFVLAQEWDLNNGNIIVNAVPGTEQTVSQAGSTPTVDNNPVITSNGNSTNNTVTINAAENATANVTLENVNINTGGAAISTSGQGNVNIELDGTNTVQSGTNHAGVEKNSTGTLTIKDENNNKGSLTATGGDRGAGIGGGNDGSGSHITISGGEVTAKGGRWAAGIGGGEDGNGSHITIEGGTVEATGGISGAGIGGGNNDNTVSNIGKGEHITIKDGTVTATGGDGAAGIGGGFAGAGSDITVSGGKVTATGGKDGGAGIGGGFGGSGSNIAIEGGKVEASSVGGGAGIGGGSLGSGSNIAVSGGEVTAQGGVGGAGIGGGQGGSGSKITISDGKVTATGAGAGAGIGGGYEGSGKSITIEGGEVTAQGDAGGAGIGGGISGTGSDVTISGDAQVKVQGGTTGRDWHKGAAIGNGGTPTTDGNEVSPNTSDLKVGGFIQIYEPGKNINTDTPDRTIEGQKGDHSWNAGEVTAETVPESKAAAYWVSDSEGQSIPYQAQQKDGVLTVTVQADTASLRGTTGSLGQLEAQGVAEIRFVTNGAQSAFTLSDLLTSGTGSFTLTHDGDKVAFTLESKDISGILK